MNMVSPWPFGMQWGRTLIQVNSDAFLDVGSTEESVGDGSRLAQHGVFRI